MATMEAVNHHHQPYPPLPASPTLTNPDMILPDYDRSASPDDHRPLDDRDHSPIMMWKNAHAASSGTDLQHMHMYFNGPSAAGPPVQQLQHQFGPAGPITPTTPIIYGNGTMLSDIGEVTEVESTPGKSASASSRSKSSGRAPSIRKQGDSGSDAALRSSPTMGLQGVPKKRSKGNLIGGQQQRERRSSIESNSTITTQDQALFADFDDSVSVGDSVFQGDDEESVADSYVEDAPAQPRDQIGGLLAPAATVTKAGSTGSGGAGSGNEDRYSTYSTTSISRRAEQILANAKRRLTTMEGNLSRARSSLYASSPYGSDGSTPSPPIIRASSALHQRGADAASSQYSPGHTRMSSDNAVTHSESVPHIYTQRSASALGAAGGYRQPAAGAKSVEHMRDGFTGHYGRSNYARDTAHLEPLSEDEVAVTPTMQSLSPEQAKKQPEAFLSPTFGPPVERGLTRSASVAQMRDLKDQMKDLKGKISSLREQARADSLKRRSLQSLRTPSPFTHARIDQWYAEPRPTQETGAGATSAGRNPWNGELSSVDGENAERGNGPNEDDADEESIVDDYGERVNRVSYIRHSVSHQTAGDDVFREGIEPEIGDASLEGQKEEDDIDDMQTENGDAEEEGVAEGAEVAAAGETPGGNPPNEEDAYESESGESDYHDTLQHPISHEDREDAFDYEHFFLHSAMGTISQQRLARRRSRDSYSSEDSVETTKGPVSSAPTANGDGRTEEKSRSRRNSTASTSTTDSFATADEGRASLSLARGDEPADGAADDYPEQVVTISGGKQPGSPQTARKTVFGPIITNGHADLDTSLRSAVLRRPLSSSATASLHRPSISSFESTGTNRSFPLVNKAKAAADSELRAIEDSLLSETASICEREQPQGHKRVASDADFEGDGGVSAVDAAATAAPAAMQMLLKEDQYLVERLVAGLGRCVLGLTESGRASAESRMYRRRIDAARRILEGLESPGAA